MLKSKTIKKNSFKHKQELKEALDILFSNSRIKETTATKPNKNISLWENILLKISDII